MIKHVLVAGGGTGGHLFPGIAVIEELRRRIPELEVTFVGTARGIENRLLPDMGERLELLTVSPLKGVGSKALLQGLSRLPVAAASALSLLRRHKPDLVIGVGGYASGPVLTAAYALGIPTAVLEQNARVGLTNRLLAPMVGRAYLSFRETESTFSGGKARLTGNPLRAQLSKVAAEALVDPDGFDARGNTILVLGGSQGSAALNREVPKFLGQLNGVQRFQVVHQAGRGDVDQVNAAYREAGVEANVVSFIDDMASAYRNAALVVARAGATTVAELIAVGRPAVLVPFPHAADDHQKRNAEVLEQQGAALCVLESELEALAAGMGESDPAQGNVRELVQNLLRTQTARVAMARAARSLGQPDAAAVVVDDLFRWFSKEDEAVAALPAEEGRAPRRGLRGTRPYVPRSRLRRCALSPQGRLALQCPAFTTSD